MAPEPFYAVILDAGSSGTRLFIYRITPKHVEGSKIVQQGKVTELLTNNGESLKKSPGKKGIQDMRTDTNIRCHLDGIFEQAKELLVEEIPAKLYVLATGGVRDRLTLRQQLTLHDLVTNYIRDLEDRFDATRYTPISGADEAKFGWVAANYLLKQSRKPPYRAGYVEMGGATAQIAFPVEARKVAEVEKVAKSLNTVEGIDALETLKEELQDWATKKANSDQLLEEAEEAEVPVDELKKEITQLADERAKAKLEAKLKAKLEVKLDARKKANEAKEKIDSEELAKLEEAADGVSGDDMTKLKQVARQWAAARTWGNEKLEAQMEAETEAKLNALKANDEIEEVVKRWGDRMAEAEAERKDKMSQLAEELEAEAEADAKFDEKLDEKLEGSNFDKSQLKEGLKQWVELDVELDGVMKQWCGNIDDLKAAGELVAGVKGEDVAAWVELNERAKVVNIGNRKLFVASFPLGMDAGYAAYKQELFTTDLAGVNDGNVFYDPSKRDGYSQEEDGNRVIKGRANDRRGFWSNFGLTLSLVHSAQEQQFTDADVEAVRPLAPIIAKLSFIGASNFFYSFQDTLKGGNLSYTEFNKRLKKSSEKKHRRVHKESCKNKTSSCGDCKFEQGIFDNEMFRLYWAHQALSSGFGLELRMPGSLMGKEVTFTPYNGHGSNENRFSWTLGTALLLASPDLEGLE